MRFKTEQKREFESHTFSLQLLPLPGYLYNTYQVLFADPEMYKLTSSSRKLYAEDDVGFCFCFLGQNGIMRHRKVKKLSEECATGNCQSWNSSSRLCTTRLKRTQQKRQILDRGQKKVEITEIFKKERKGQMRKTQKIYLQHDIFSLGL